jgi:hypothetical protein
MQLSPKLLLIAIPSSIGLGISLLKSDARLSSAIPTDSPLPKVWTVRPIDAPTPVDKSTHQLLLDRQKQVSNLNLSCDCNGCRMAAAQAGVRIN